MATYYVDDGGDNSTGADWATAYTSINSLDAAVALASDDIVYFGHDSQCQALNAGSLTITGPASGAPCVFISVTQGSTPPTYQKGTGNQIDTTEGAYSVIFDGSFALYGIKINAGATSYMPADANEVAFVDDVTLMLPANGSSFPLIIGGGVASNLVVDLTNDGTTPRSAAVLTEGAAGPGNIYKNLSFVNAGYRTGTVFTSNASNASKVVGGDFSGFVNATPCEILPTGLTGSFEFLNCKTAATWTPHAGAFTAATAKSKFINCGSADQPVSLITQDYAGGCASSSSIYRTGGASFESTANAWLMTTTANANKHAPLYSEYIYGTIASTGAKTFDVYVTNDTADLNDDEIWLEVEYKADASSGEWTLATDKPATITTAAAAQTDDVTSTWNGAGPAFTYKQKLSVAATIGTTGQYRARVAVGKASVGAASNLYVDPKVTVS